MEYATEEGDNWTPQVYSHLTANKIGHRPGPYHGVNIEVLTTITIIKKQRALGDESSTNETLQWQND